jgi:FMN-dependent NADH-azoreductase
VTILVRIDASPRTDKSHSRRMANELVERLLAACPALTILDRDLGAGPAAAVDGHYVDAMLTTFTREQSVAAAALSLSETFIAELERADLVVISTPVHNYTVPASLKAWIDHVVRVGRTFRPTPTGKVGLLKDRPTFVVAASGGYFSSTEARQPDFFTPYMDAVLRTIGIFDVHHVRLEGLARGEAAIAAAQEAARAQVASILADFSAADAPAS